MRLLVKLMPCMATIHDIERLEKEIGERIAAAIKADPRSPEEIAAELDLTPGALKRIQDGKSTTQWAKLAQLAAVLRRTPNELLGVEDTARDALIGALEGVFEALSQDPVRVQELVGIVLKVIDTREFGDPCQPHRERARLIANFLTLQSVESQRK